MNSELEPVRTSIVEPILQTFGYSTRRMSGRFALIGVGRDRVILLRSEIANGRTAVREVNSALDGIFFERKLGAHTFEIYVIIICDENVPDAERYAMEADTNICRKITIPSNVSRPEQMSSWLIGLRPLDLTALTAPSSTRVEDIFADVLRQNTPGEVAGVLSQAFRESWPVDRILNAVKGSPS